eukprot:TRINITY_DN22699_c0_g1_i1.p1 TRINITY_DN22699_c0_g1~~TRINITY_DN22699_c0_g1_i1.p1  ORF type:complete len:714 (+),score=221.73 TRINITY_DN22699_c0_g1_i1:73-2142(+)
MQYAEPSRRQVRALPAAAVAGALLVVALVAASTGSAQQRRLAPTSAAFGTPKDGAYGAPPGVIPAGAGDSGAGCSGSGCVPKGVSAAVVGAAAYGGYGYAPPGAGSSPPGAGSSGSYAGAGAPYQPKAPAPPPATENRCCFPLSSGMGPGGGKPPDACGANRGCMTNKSDAGSTSISNIGEVGQNGTSCTASKEGCEHACGGVWCPASAPPPPSAPAPVSKLSLEGSLAAAQAIRRCAAAAGFKGTLAQLLQDAKAVDSKELAAKAGATRAGKAMCDAMQKTEGCLVAGGEAEEPLAAPIRTASDACRSAEAPPVAPSPPVGVKLSVDGAVAAAAALQKCVAASGYKGSAADLLDEARKVDSKDAAAKALATKAGQQLCDAVDATEACLAASGQEASPLVAPARSASAYCRQALAEVAAAGPRPAAAAQPGAFGGAAASIDSLLSTAQLAQRCVLQSGYGGALTQLLTDAAAIDSVDAARAALGSGQSGRQLCAAIDRTHSCLAANGAAAQPLVAPIGSASRNCHLALAQDTALQAAGVSAVSIDGVLGAAAALKQCAAQSGYKGSAEQLLKEADAVKSEADAAGLLATKAGAALCSVVDNTEACLAASGQAGQPLVAPVRSASHYCKAAAAAAATQPAPGATSKAVAAAHSASKMPLLVVFSALVLGVAAVGLRSKRQDRERTLYESI